MKYNKEQFIDLRNQGKSHKDIAIIIGCSKSTVSYYIHENQYGKRKEKTCRNCTNKIRAQREFCSWKCYKENQDKNRKDKLLKGELLSNDTIKKALIVEFDDVCSICGIGNIWNNKNLVLQVDHIDGNSDNNKKENVRLVCPNCHSQLGTSKGSCGISKETKRNKYLRRFKGYMPS